MKHVSLTVKGISPLLMHRYPMIPIEALDKKPPEEQAELAAYRDDAGLFVPGVAFQRALVGGATYSKGKGRGSLQKVAAASVFVTPANLSLGVREYVVDGRPVVIAATKGRVMRYRPRLDEWKFSCQLEYDETLLTETQLRRIVDDTGSRVGLLDFRPARNGSFGRFVVVKWEAA